jgi:exosome complex RNA-binding protein Csl4
MDIDQIVHEVERIYSICSRCKVPMQDGVIVTSYRSSFKVCATTELRKCKKCPLCGFSRVHI